MEDMKKEKLDKMSLKEQITELRKRTKQEPEAMISEKEINGFNDTLQRLKKAFPNEPFLMRVTSLGYGVTILDLYIKMTLISELLEGEVEELEEQVKKLKRDIDGLPKRLEQVKNLLYGKKSQG